MAGLRPSHATRQAHRTSSVHRSGPERRVRRLEQWMPRPCPYPAGLEPLGASVSSSSGASRSRSDGSGPRRVGRGRWLAHRHRRRRPALPSAPTQGRDADSAGSSSNTTFALARMARDGALGRIVRPSQAFVDGALDQLDELLVRPLGPRDRRSAHDRADQLSPQRAVALAAVSQSSRSRRCDTGTTALRR